MRIAGVDTNLRSQTSQRSAAKHGTESLLPVALFNFDFSVGRGDPKTKLLDRKLEF